MPFCDDDPLGKLGILHGQGGGGGGGGWWRIAPVAQEGQVPD
jgi:hypothetical protein